MTTVINQQIKTYSSARRENKYRDNDGHEQSVSGKRDLLIGNFRLPVIRNTGKLYESNIVKGSTSNKSGLQDNNYGVNGDHGPSVFNNLDSLIKISNFRPSAVFNNGKLYAADGRKNSKSGKSGSSHNRFGFLKATAGFSIPGEREKASGYRKVKYPDVKQDQESDFEFLTRLAQRNHFEFFVFGRTLYFRAPANDEDPILSLEWGKTLISFSPELDLTNQVSEVEVRGWDVTAKKEITGTAKKGDEQGTDSGRKTGSELIQNAYNTKIIEHIRLPLFSQEEADRMARTILNRHAEGLVKGAGQTIGIPELLAGKNIELKGLGTKFSKAYYIESTSHVISGSGYQTTFNVKSSG
ncbi:MAG: hypothetical protein WC364_08870 [Eubacteriales bacterium]|jgi:hypothetical protein